MMKWMLMACFMLVLCVTCVSGESELVIGVKHAEPFVIISGIAISGFAIATFSGAMVITPLPVSTIQGPGELYARPVAVIAGTHSVHLVEERGIYPVPVKSLDDAITQLKAE